MYENKKEYNRISLKFHSFHSGKIRNIVLFRAKLQPWQDADIF